MDLLQDPRYKDAPVYLFFEKYILDVIGHLPPEKIEILNQINLQNIFATKAEPWKAVVKEVLQLSSTIDIAILYQWYKYMDRANENGTPIDSNTFSQNFVDEYFTKDSDVDVWTEESLLKAKQYIQNSKIKENA